MDDENANKQLVRATGDPVGLMRYGHFESFCNMDIIFEQSKCTYIIIMYNELKLWIWKFI